MFHIVRDEKLVSWMEGKTNFSKQTGCQEPGLLSVCKSLAWGVIWNSLMARPDWPWPEPRILRQIYPSGRSLRGIRAGRCGGLVVRRSWKDARCETHVPRCLLRVVHQDITARRCAQCVCQAWTGHCAIVPWHRHPPSTNTDAPWPLRNFLINRQ